MKSKSHLQVILILTILFTACTETNNKTENLQTGLTDTANSKKAIAAMLDSFNIAAANAAFDNYFNFYTADATFNGTDATENWDKKAFMIWAKPFFDKKTTWSFTAMKRNIYFGKYAGIAWFEELLSTQMKICRGSGVVVKQDDKWKVQQYVLSTTIPNDLLDTIIKIKAPTEDVIIKKLSGK